MVVLQTLHAGGSTSTSTLPLSCCIFFHLVDAIQRVEKIKQRRQDRFVKNRSVLLKKKRTIYVCGLCVSQCDVIFPRLKAGLKLQEEAEKREVEQGIHLLQDPRGA